MIRDGSNWLRILSYFNFPCEFFSFTPAGYYDTPTAVERDERTNNCVHNQKSW